MSESTPVVTCTPGLISIVIPAFNVSRGIERMLDSIYAQTYKNLEVIVAYDTKSTDNTLSILKKYEEKYGLIIDEARDESSGQARNRGARLATGEYFIYLDGDDILIPDYLKRLLNTLQEHPELDVVCGNFIKAKPKKIQKKYQEALDSEDTVTIYTQKEVLDLSFMQLSPGAKPDIELTPWIWLIKREFMIKYNIQFPNFTLFDDWVYVAQLIANTPEIGYCKKMGYIWVQYPTSTSNSPNAGETVLKKLTMCRNYLLEILPEEKYPGAVETLIYSFMESAKDKIAMGACFYPIPEYRETLKKYDIKKFSIPKNVTVTWWLHIMLFNISPLAFRAFIRTRAAVKCKKA